MIDMIATPYIWSQPNIWLGLDGNWSTLPISVGSPPQHFSVLPSTSGSQVWVPHPEGCSWWSSTSIDCPASRGVNSPTYSQGFQANASSSWCQLAIYELSLETELYGKDETGLYGLDTVVLPGQNASSDIGNQLVAAVASAEFWIGSLGLSDAENSLDMVNKDLPSLLTSMAGRRLVPSRSYGYAAGAAYRNSPASLILGGYDEAATTPASISFTIPQNRSLIVNLVDIVATNTMLGTASMLAGSPALSMRIDSAISQLWLPSSLCEMMTRAFDLLYDSSTNLYLVNTTTHARLQQLNPELTFTLAPDSWSNTTVNIVFPYAAFDLKIGLPVYNTTYHCFPIRSAANETQFVLGRAFLQEAYLIVDWERSNFTIGQVVHSRGQAKSVVMIPSVISVGGKEAYHLSVGGLASIVVSAVLIIVVSICCYWWRRKASKARTVSNPEDLSTEEASSTLKGQHKCSEEKSRVELMSEAMHELNAGPKAPLQIMSTEVFELDAASPSQELDGGSPAASTVYEKW